MSRHEIPSLDPAHKVIVGWDPPLLTYYAQVIDRAIEAAGDERDGAPDKFVLWIGTLCYEIYEVEHLRRRISKYAELSPEIGATLYGDKDEGN